MRRILVKYIAVLFLPLMLSACAVDKSAPLYEYDPNKKLPITQLFVEGEESSNRTLCSQYGCSTSYNTENGELARELGNYKIFKALYSSAPSQKVSEEF